MNNSRVAETKRRPQRVLYADAEVLVCLFLMAVRPGLHWFDGLFRAGLQVDRCEANLMTTRFAAATVLIGIPVAATFPAIATAQHQGSKSPRRISDIVPSSLHSQQRQQWLSGRPDMLHESSWKPCVKIIPEYSDDSTYCDGQVRPVQPLIVVICGPAQVLSGLLSLPRLQSRLTACPAGRAHRWLFVSAMSIHVGAFRCRSAGRCPRGETTDSRSSASLFSIPATWHAERGSHSENRAPSIDCRRIMASRTSSRVPMMTNMR